MPSGSNKPKNNDAKRQGLTHNTLIGFFWSASGKFGQAILQFTVLAILSRLLTPEDYGLANLANVITTLTTMAFQIGLSPSLIQRDKLTNDHIRSAFTVSVLLGAFLTALVYTAAPFVTGFFRDMPELTNVIRGLSFTFVISGVGTVATALNYRNLNFKIKARFQLVSYFVGYAFVGVPLALLGYGVWAIIWASLTQAAVSAACFLRVSPHDKRPQLSWPALKGLLSFGLGFNLGQIFFRIGNTSDNLLVGATLGAAAVGIYGQAFRLLTLPAIYFGQVLDSVLFSAMARVQNNTAVLRTVYRRGVVLIALVVMPLSALFFVLAPELIRVLLGEQWGAVIVPFRILTLSMLCRTSLKMSESLSRSSGAVYRRAWWMFVFAVMVIGGTWAGHYWGVAGVAVGVSLAIVVNFLALAHLSLQITGMTWLEFFKIHLPAFGLTAFVLAESWGLATLLRSVQAGALVTFAGSTLVVGTSVLALSWLFPNKILGPDGVWIMGTLGNYLPVRLRQRLLRYHA